MAYVDGFIVAVPAANKEAYRKLALDYSGLFREFGAVRMVETWGDDVPDGKVTDFRRAVKAEPGEIVVFSWFEYPSKAVRDAANQKMRSDPRMQSLGAEMPFDFKRMVYGGFEVMLDDKAGGEMGYVDGSVIAVPEGNKESYGALSAKLSKVLKEHGATRVVNTWGDDVPDGKITDFKGAVKATADERVVFTWIEWPSKAARDAGWGKVMADSRMYEDPAPYDNGRRIHGGFAPIVDV
jgi:uncharacterized protein YbaA (DUF1428 family)